MLATMMNSDAAPQVNDSTTRTRAAGPAREVGKVGLGGWGEMGMQPRQGVQNDGR